MARTLATARTPFAERAAVLAPDRPALLAALRELAADGAHPALVTGVARRTGLPVLVFPGQGSQWVGMGRELLVSSPVFAARMGECAAALAPFVEWELVEVLGDAELLGRVDVVQPVLWAVMVSLAAVWEAAGVVPSAVVGHSQGEIAAACVAGALSLADGARVVALRSKAIAGSLAGRGGMVSVALPRADVEPFLRAGVEVAAVNGPAATVIAGASAPLEEVFAALAVAGVQPRRIAVDYASHSVQVELIRAEVLDALAAVSPRPSRIPFHSSVTGGRIDTTTLDAAYWYENLRSTVLFEQAVASLGEAVFVECSPHPVLASALPDATGTLRRDDGGWDRFLTSAAQAHAAGVPVAWPLLLGEGARAELPTYPFQRTRYWLPDQIRTAADRLDRNVGEVDVRDADFWDAVERGDQAALTAMLGADATEALTAPNALPVLPALTRWRRDRTRRAAVDGWRYRVVWRPVTARTATALGGHWIVVTTGEQPTQPTDRAQPTEPTRPTELADLVAALRAHGAETVTVTDLTDPAGLAAQLPTATGVLSLLPLAQQGDAAFDPQASLALCQAVARAEVPLWTATRGAVATGTADRLDHPGQAAVWGLGRVLALEHPAAWGGLIDLPARLDRRALDRLCALLAGAHGDEDQVALRASGLFVRRLVAAPARPTTATPWQPEGTVLVTGGTGALGARVARLLAARGVRHLLLAGRRGPAAPGAAELVAELAELGCTATVAACDVSDRAALAALLATVPADRPVGCAVHAAGTGEGIALADTTAEDLRAALAAKTLGAAHLDALLPGTLVLFSSGAATWGSAGQAAYGAANACLDALAEHRRGRGLPALSIAWGAWDGGGMVDEQVRAHLSLRGLNPMDPDLALTALEEAVTGGESTLVVADIDWDRFLPLFTSARPRPLTEAFARSAPVPEAAGTAGPDGLDALPAVERERRIRRLVLATAAAVLGHDSADALDPERSFSELGVNSLTAVDLRNRLAAALGRPLPPTLAFDHPTPARLAAHLIGAAQAAAQATAQGAAGAIAEADTPARSAPTAAAVDDDPIVVVSAACRLPGGVRSPEDLWQLLAEGRDAVTAFPTDRGWDLDALYDPDPGRPGRTYAFEGGFLADAGGFDADFFGISPREALAMDPQQRVLLETAWEAVERAGIDPGTLRGSDTGVFVGAIHQGYGVQSGAVPPELEGYFLTGNAASVISGRVAYTLGLAGPAVTVDTACSSSLVAIHWAAQALRSGECTLALAGGVTVMASPATFVEFSRQRGLAADGRCKSFADAADGTGWAEGAGVVLLERLSDARRNGHRVLGVLRGSAVNSDGASNGLAAPNGPAQERVIRQALADAGLTAAEVDAVEGHGTGTRLGDPIEAHALLATYGQQRQEPLWLGSLKSNIGHAQAASGVAGVIKLLLALGHGVLPRTLHVDAPSTQVSWGTGAVELLTEEVAWPETGRPRRAAISAFGVSGTNAHLILEQAPPQPAPEPSEEQPDAPVPVLLSAAGPAALRAQATRLRAHLATDRPPLRDVAFTLAATRAGLRHRRALVVGDRDELLAALDAVAAGPDAPAAGPGAGTALVFSGQGSQRLGAGRELRERFAVFADAYDEVCARFDGLLPKPLIEVAHGRDAELLARTEFAQPALFALQTALFRLVRSWGVRPAVLLGHSVGELAAAHAAGALSLDDAVALVAARGRLMQALPGGAMVAVDAAEELVRPLLTEGVELGAVNGPSSVVLSGHPEAVAAVAARLAAAGHRTKRLAVGHAFHSALIEPALDGLRAAASSLVPGALEFPVLSTVTGRPVDAATLASADHWVGHARATVRFADAVRHATADGVTDWLEVGPDAVLAPLLADGAVPLLRADRAEPHSALAAVAALHERGAAVDTAALVGGGRRVELPGYAFQHEHFWLHPAPAPAPDTARTGADTAFWAAVEAADLDALSTEAADDGADQAADRAALAAALPALSRWRGAQRARSAAEGHRYRVRWQPAGELSATAEGDWLVVHPPGLGTDWAAGLAAPSFVTPSFVTPSFETRSFETLCVDPEQADPGAEVARALAGRQVAGVLSLLGLDTAPHPLHPGVPRGTAATLSLARAGLSVPLWLATAGAVAVGRADAAPDPAAALVWGLGRVLALEQPDAWGGLIDLPATADPRAVERLRRVLRATGGEDQVALRASGVFVPRLVRAPLERTERRGGWTPGGTVLVTGGTGGLGAQTARRLLAAGAAHVVLAGRRGPRAAGTAALQAELGTRVTIAACDVTDRAALAELVTGHRITAVVHAAGIGQATPLARTGLEEFAEVLAAKVTGAAHLDDLLGAEAEAFVLYSSVSGVWGAGDQGGYAAANAYLLALAERRRARGLKATALAWGPWAGDGMAAGAVGEHLRRRGLTELAPAAALDALVRALADDDSGLVLADVDWARFTPAFTAARPRPLLAALPEADAATAQPDPGQSAAAPGAVGLAALPPAELRPALTERVLAATAAVLGHADPARVAPERAFTELGFDSLTALDLRNRLTESTALRLPATLVFDHPSPAALIDHLVTLLAGRATEPAGPTAPAGAARTEEPIAIVGMGCRFPGGVRDPQGLWQLLVEGRDAITGFPTDRGWDVEHLYHPDPDHPGTSYVREGGFLDAAGDFDADFFGIGPREAAAMDPQQRLLLETAWEGFESAGIDPQAVRDTATGVFVGLSYQGYGLGAAPDGAEGYLLTGTTTSVASGRLAYALGLTGPAITVDTACSSSLVALHLAVQSLRAGECSLALAGGATVMASPATFVEFSRQRGLAADGRCKAFADGADGTGWGEGAAVLLVERLSDAQRHGHPVLAVVRGSAVNSDGASNGLTAPNGPAQQRVIRSALAAAGLAPAEVDAVEAHGTGTALGDPIEAQALLATYGQDRQEPLWLGSVKSNIGHTQAAAGAAGLIKTVLALRAGVLPRTLHAATPSSHVDWSGGAVRLLAEQRAWPETGRPRRAAVSAFGISGTNAHVVLEQAPPAAPSATPPAPATGPAPLLLSGRTAAGLRAQAARLLDHLRAYPDDTLHDVGRSLAAGRPRLERRAVIVADDRERAIARLAALADDAPLAAPVRSGSPAVVFSGQGAQHPGMGRELYAAFPVFADAFDEVCAHFDLELPLPLREVVLGRDTEPLERTEYAQPALFAVEVALYRLVRSFGLRPRSVAGHSIGGITAAYVAGLWSLPDACRLVAARGRLMQAMPPGAMAAIEADEHEVSGIALAAVNAPGSVVVSGTVAEVEAVMAHWRERGRRVTRLRVGHAFHSPLMDGMLADFAQVLRGLAFAEPSLPVVSDLTGRLATAAQLRSPEYWVRHLRETVRFADVVGSLGEAGVGTVVELGPDAALTPAVRGRESLTAVAAQRAGRDGLQALVEALAELHVAGVPLDWRALYEVLGGRTTPVPTTAFQHRRFWLAAANPAANTAADVAANTTPDVDRWTHRVAWTALPAGAPEGNGNPLAGDWLVVGDRERETVRACVAGLTRAGARVQHTASGTTTGVLSLLALGHDGPELLARTAGLLRDLDEQGVAAPLWLATFGADQDPGQAALTALGRTVAAEAPHRWGGLADLARTASSDDFQLLATALAAGGEDQLTVRDGQLLAARLRPVKLPAAATWRPSGTALVTGGTGALGAQVARWLVRCGARHLVLTGRRGPAAPGAAELVAELTGLGAEVDVVACDLTDRAAVAGLIAAYPPSAVFHAAGALDDGVLGALTAERFAEVWRPKAEAAVHLHELAGELDAFVLFSSMAGTLGSAGQGNYAAANAALDALARARRAAGQPATAIAWGPWAGDGMAAEPAALERMRRGGVHPMAAGPALALLHRALSGSAAALVAADVDWPRYAGERRISLLAESLGEPGSTESGPVRTDYGRLPVADRPRVLLDAVRSHAAAVLGHPGPEAVDAERPFRDLGFDSLGAVDLRNRLAAETGLALSAALVFNHPTPNDLAAHLGALLFPAEPGAAQAPAGPDDEDLDLSEASDDELFELLDEEFEN
ncbi:SDR family NAD(P)-dependent oxidoreductase [Kitasatospora sp. NBC_01250]